MKQRISAGAIIIKNEKILLVHHKKEGQFDFWVPPGGGLENDEGIFKCVEREVFEETNLRVKPEKIAYLEELIDEDTYVFKIWVICSIIGGELSLCNLETKENFLKDARFFGFEELKKIKVFPEFIKTILWKDYKEGFPQIKFVGFHKDNLG